MTRLMKVLVFVGLTSVYLTQAASCSFIPEQLGHGIGIPALKTLSGFLSLGGLLGT